MLCAVSGTASPHPWTRNRVTLGYSQALLPRRTHPAPSAPFKTSYYNPFSRSDTFLLLGTILRTLLFGSKIIVRARSSALWISNFLFRVFHSDVDDFLNHILAQNLNRLQLPLHNLGLLVVIAIARYAHSRFPGNPFCHTVLPCRNFDLNDQALVGGPVCAPVADMRYASDESLYKSRPPYVASHIAESTECFLVVLWHVHKSWSKLWGTTRSVNER